MTPAWCQCGKYTDFLLTIRNLLFQIALVPQIYFEDRSKQFSANGLCFCKILGGIHLGKEAYSHSYTEIRKCHRRWRGKRLEYISMERRGLNIGGLPSLVSELSQI